MLVAKGAEEVIETEIEREVQSLDRKSVEQRSKYFQEKLNLDWFNGTIVPILDQAIRYRNRILHEDVTAKVSDGDLTMAGIAAVLPMWCCLQGVVLYPAGFTMSNVNTEELRASIQNARKTSSGLRGGG